MRDRKKKGGLIGFLKSCFQLQFHINAVLSGPFVDLTNPLICILGYEAFKAAN